MFRLPQPTAPLTPLPSLQIFHSFPARKTMQNYAQLLLLLLLFSVSQQKTKTNKEIKVFPPKQEEIR